MKSLIPTPNSGDRPTNLVGVCMDLPFCIFYVSGIIQFMEFSVWLLPLSMSVRFIHVMTYSHALCYDVSVTGGPHMYGSGSVRLYHLVMSWPILICIHSMMLA